MAEEKVSLIIEAKERFSQAFDNFNKALQSTGTYISNFDTKVNSVREKIDKMNGTVGTLVTTLGGFSILKGSYDEFQKNEQALIKLNKAFDKSQGAIGLTKKELMQLRDEIDSSSLFGGDEIAEAQAKLISFGTVGGDMFKRASQVMADFATETKTDMTSAAQFLGKALSEPADALNRLAREGIYFTPVQEKLIKDAAESGNIWQAQNILLGELEKKYRGAAAGATEGTGQIGLLKESVEEFAEELGRLIAEFLVPFATFLRTDVIPVMKEWSTEIAVLTGVLATAAIGWGAFYSVLTIIPPIIGAVKLAWAGLMIVINATMAANPLVITCVAAVAAVAALITMINNMGPVVDWISEKWTNMFGSEEQKAAMHAQKMKEINDKKAKEEKEAQEKEQKEKEGATAAYYARLEKMRQDAADKKKIADDAAAAKKIEDDKAAAIKKAEDDRKAKIKAEEDEIKKKYGFLSKEDRKYLKDKENEDKKTAREQVTAARKAAASMTDEEKDFIKDRQKAEDKLKADKAQKEMATFRRKEKLMEKMTSSQADMVIAEEERISKEKEAQENHRFAIENNIGDARLVATQDFFGQMAQLQQSKSQEMFEVGKAFAIGQAVMSTYTGVAKTLEMYPFPLSVPMAAAQLALGIQQVQQISSSAPQFEDGGIVPGTSYTGDMVAARVNSGEMILNQRQQKNLFNKIDTDSLDAGQKNVYNVSYKINVTGNGDKALRSLMEKTIEKTEKRKLQKAQFVKGRFAT